MSIIEKTAIFEIAKNYNLTTERKQGFFDTLWNIYKVGNRYRKQHEDAIQSDLAHNYRCIAAAILKKNSVEFNIPNFGVNSRNFSNNNVFKTIKTLTLKSEEDRNSSTNNSTVMRRPSDDSSMRRPIGNSTSTSMTRPEETAGLSRYVIFSDHHLTPRRHSHNYFSEGQNESLYMKILNYYGNNDYGLIENGDVEEYTIFEPTPQILNRYNNLLEINSPFNPKRKIDWSELKEERINNRINILTDILSDHSRLYDIIDRKFASKGKEYYTKITGNHDPYVNSRLKDVLPDFLKNNLCDGLRIIGKNKNEPKYFITHGHQFDTSTLPQHAFAIGEIFSETLGWCIQGADRIWDEAKTNQWRNPEINATFRNILATADSEAIETRGLLDEGIESVVETLMQNHEIAWEYFDNQRRGAAIMEEVLTGDEYFKVRHLSETRLVEALNRIQTITELSDYVEPTKLIIGHTHEPRLNSRTGVNDGNIVSNYINTGSAGRFDNLIWGVELIDGVEKVISWTNIGTLENAVLRRDQWTPTGDGRFIKSEYPL